MPDTPSFKSLADMKRAAGSQPSGKVRMCPACGKRLLCVAHERRLPDGSTRRQRKCSSCGAPAGPEEASTDGK